MENTALSEELIAKNKEEFIGLVRSIARPDCYVEDLVQMLELSDFFTAPVTTNAFRNYDGGLCEQALSRYHNLIQLAQTNVLGSRFSSYRKFVCRSGKDQQFRKRLC